MEFSIVTIPCNPEALIEPPPAGVVDTGAAAAIQAEIEEALHVAALKQARRLRALAGRRIAFA